MKIGNIPINQAIVLAPMEDVSDYPFRILCRKLGADIVYTEFTNSEALIRSVKKAIKKITIHPDERPVAIQIYGGINESMEQAASIAESFAPDFIDINCGCWVKKVANRGEGAGLLRDLKKFEQIVRSTIKGTKLPVTVKTRLGWDENSIVILEAAKMVEAAGAQALTVHCRTRCQGYKGEADWSWLEKIKKQISIPLFGNGDCTTPEDIKRMFETGCDGVMIGRGAIGNPWVFRQAKHYLKTGAHLPPISLEEKVDVILEHLQLSCEHRGEERGVVTFRKHYAGYLKGVPHIAKLRADLMRLVTFEDVAKRLKHFLRETASSSLVSV